MGRLQDHPGQHPGQDRRQDRRDRHLSGHGGEGGSSPIIASVSIFIFLLFLLLAVQVVFNLYATSMVTAAAYDGARLAAGAGSEADPAAAEAAARAHIRSLLGAYGGSSERLPVVTVERGTELTVVTVEAVNPSFLPPALRRPVGLDRISRTVRVRTEAEVAGP